MTQEEITELINDFASTTIPNSITPMSVATILHEMNLKIEDPKEEEPKPEEPIVLPTVASAIPEEWFMGRLIAKNTSATVEQELCVGDIDTDEMSGKLVRFNSCDDSEPLIKANQRCWVEITGFVTLRATDSYTADRILRIFIINAEGERVFSQSNTVHFTGTTQIFSVPICYNAHLAAGDVLHLTHYSSSGTSSISANSWLNIKVHSVTK